MEVIEPILSIASEIYSLVENVKANKKRCQRVSKRVRSLEELVKPIKQREMDKTENGDVVKKALAELSFSLQSAKELVKKYTMANWVERILKCSSHGDEFSTVNDRLNDAFQVLSGALQVQQGSMLHKVFEETSRDKEDKVDGMEDDQELKTLLLEYIKVQQEKTDAMLKEFEDVKINVGKIVDLLEKPNPSNETIRIIKSKELKYEPKPFMATSTSEVYKGEFNGFPVAIKRYLDTKSTNPGAVEQIFKKEVDTMKCFESPNILRIFGICIQKENYLHPAYLIIMEYCDKGSLRQVLDNKKNIPWTRKARMCLDAAQGLYRLHQTEEKSKVHGCINSSKFLVADGYRVKLGGFELAKTETSLRKQSKDTETRPQNYSAPEMLDDINRAYSMECEIYSFGIVLWEVATHNRPFEGCSIEEIHKKVFSEKYQEPLPDNCPKPLADVINACRDYDSFRRPSAGVLVDKLRSLVETLEE